MPPPACPIHPALRALVTRVAPYDSTHRVDEVHVGLPGPSATLIVSFDEPLDIGRLAEPARHAQHWLSVSGLDTRPALIRTNGRLHGIQFDLTPLGVRRLIGVPMAAIARDIVPLTGVAPAPWAPRYEQLLGLADDVARTREAQRLLVAHLDRDQSLPDDLDHAWRLLRAAGGDRTVASLADHLGWSRRHLVTRFTAEFGLSPKEAARLFRFDRARSLAARGRPLAAVAADCGFADQPHLTREWRSMAGRSPKQTLRSDYTFLQDVESAVDGHSGHE